MEGARGSARFTPAGVGASYSLLIAGGGVWEDLFGQPEAYENFGYLLTALATLACYLAVGFICAWAVGAASALVLKRWSAAVTLALFLPLGLYSLFVPSMDAYPIPLPFVDRGPTLGLVLISGVVGLALLAALRPASVFPVWPRAMAIGGPAAALMLAIVAAHWQLAYDGPGWIWLIVLLPLATLALALRLSATARSGIAVLMLLLLAVSGIAAWRAERTFAPANQLGGANGEIPRIFLITIDTLRADALRGPSGGKASTPALDAFASEAIVFENAISSGGWTPPGMTSMVTGLDPFSHGVGIGRTTLPEEIPTLPDRLASSSYQVAGVGLNAYIRTVGLVDRYPWIHWHPYRPFGLSVGNRILTNTVDFYLWNPSSAQLADWAIDWAEQNQDEEFFFWLHFYDPHIPYTPPEEFVDRSGQTTLVGEYLDWDEVEKVRAVNPPLGVAEREWVKTLYNSEVAYVDQNVGRVLERLRELGVYDDSLIIISSDHGEELFDHGGFEHGQSLYNELVHVPLMVRPPGGADGRVVRDFVGTAAVTPTILDLAGVEAEDGDFSYESLRSYLEAAEAGEAEMTEHRSAEPVFSSGVHFKQNWVSVVFDHYKYIRREVTRREELYDMIADPGETAPLDDPELLERGRALIKERVALGNSMRKRYGVEHGAEEGLDESTKRQLESLGYIQ